MACPLPELGERTSYVYDAAGREVEKQLANDTRTTTIYDAAGRTVRTTDLASSGAVIAGFAYDYAAAGRRTVEVRHSCR